MSRIYRDYFNQTVLTIPDSFIDVKTGEKRLVAPPIIEQLEYHSRNNTLQHFIISALTSYLIASPNHQGHADEVLQELLEIKRMLQVGNGGNHNMDKTSVGNKFFSSGEVGSKEIEDVLEAFGG
ncbi:hypothetical protein SAMN05216353_12411 [Halobacillus alkaliphilus]|uniref:Uncharacterized protein n=1 Tax=Halobacillus alkaliphilus TaxID=396056 RepID=A0A1I2P9U9_9BACI|nr:hypothetical protein [Halobacillus alkaliphilus]SFG12932.1 hypothetical protein SAMN05216353_12411 [Halobacillus alkaliphilus]